MAISDGYKNNFQTLRRAVLNKELALVECTDKITGKTVIAVCAVNNDNGNYVISPLAKLFDGDPYAELNPPA